MNQRIIEIVAYNPIWPNIFESEHSLLVRTLGVRDYLRMNPQVSKEYGELKKRIIKTCKNDIGNYCRSREFQTKSTIDFRISRRL
ncbi:MAG: hypothetical protein HN366_04475 [Deltaproteobacteria bacterium]|jgi:GrpB-like predicted nucleotidyltransferase (UPF0157 family)|nr:hypothetical protein [Deltaproteobacteria bacterium]